MPTLYFEKISRFDRKAEPVTVSIPFAQGRLVDPAQLCILDGEVRLPAQVRPLATWPDGSVKWVLAHFQADLPGNADKTLHFEVSESSSPAPESPARLTLKHTPDGIHVDTGPLAFFVPNTGFLPLRNVTLNGESVWGATPFGGFTLRYDGQEANTASEPVSLTLEEAGPLRAVILVEGRRRPAAGSPYLDFRGRITAYAGKTYVEIEHQFLHTCDTSELSLQALQLVFRPRSALIDGPARLHLGEGYYRTRIRESEGEPLALTLTTETLLYQANEHFVDSFYGDFWADWCDARCGLTLSIYQAHQNFPKALRVDQAGITCDLYPADVPPARMLQGMAKTHRLQLHFHPPEMETELYSTRSLQFQLPDRPALPRIWFRENNPWREQFFPEKLPDKMITIFSHLHDSRPKALGMFHFGDAPDIHYTDQGRGQGYTVWVNNEYDRPHACALFYGLTGQRRVLDSSLVSARHWLDVDLCHYHPDPLIDGGLRIHSRDHVSGGVTPSHEWVEGFLDYYFLTGRSEGLAAARSVAENMLRHMARPHMREPGQAAVREGGWALRALVGMALGTHEPRWKDEARKLVELYLDWLEAYGALLAPYTSHSMPRVPFMMALTANSFARYLLIEDDPTVIKRVETLIINTVDDVLEHCMGPDGILYYKELPSLRRVAPTQHMLEALTHAYRITGERSYLEIATRQFSVLIERHEGVSSRAKRADDNGAVIVGVGGGRFFADRYTSLLLYIAAATPLGLLDWFEYPY